MMKKFCSVLLALTLLLGAFPVSALAAGTYPAVSSNHLSIVTALQSIHVDSSFSNRSKIAAANNISGYRGTASENIRLLSLAKAGRLKMPAAATPVKTTSTKTTSTKTTSTKTTSTKTAASPYLCSNYYECSTGGTCYEITKANAPLRAAPNDKGTVIAKLPLGKLIRVKQIVKNNKGNRWARVEYSDRSGSTKSAYMYTGNIKQHTTHSYLPVMTTSAGTVDLCTVCGLGVARTAKAKATCDLMCTADQMVRGDYSGRDTTFWGLVGRIAAGEVPFVGTAADVRDLVYDLTHGSSLGTVTVDVLAFLPLVGSLKALAKVDNLKYVDDAAGLAKQASIPWTTWKNYPKATKNGRTYAKIGNFYYTEHAVNEFMPSNIQKYTFRGVNAVDTSRGIPPSYVDWVLTDGVKNGSTIKVSSWVDKTDGLRREKYINGSLDVVVSDKNIVVTVISTDRSTAEYLALYNAHKK